MFRNFASAIFLTLTVTAAQAGDSREEQIHKAAEKACAELDTNSLPLSFYGVTYRTCIDRVTRVTLRKMDDEAQARTMSSTVALANN